MIVRRTPTQLPKAIITIAGCRMDVIDFVFAIGDNMPIVENSVGEDTQTKTLHERTRGLK